MAQQHGPPAPDAAFPTNMPQTRPPAPDAAQLQAARAQQLGLPAADPAFATRPWDDPRAYMPLGPGSPDLTEPAFGSGPLPVHYAKIKVTGDNQQALFESQPIRLPGPAAQQRFKIQVTGENGDVLSEIDKPKSATALPGVPANNPDEHFVIIRVGFEGKETFDLPTPKSAKIGILVRTFCEKMGKDTADVVV